MPRKTLTAPNTPKMEMVDRLMYYGILIQLKVNEGFRHKFTDFLQRKHPKDMDLLKVK
jgi:hypothetical protein